nr:VTT domain-containing protein [uncultured Blautia sp.]
MKKQILTLIIFFTFMIGITIWSIPYITSLYDPEIQKAFKEWISTLGIYGTFVILLIQIAQVIIAFIPGEPIEIIAGALYGGIKGLLICIVGCVIASGAIFYLCKKFGLPFVDKFFNKRKLEKYNFLYDSEKLDIVIFILFFVPGTPKDMLTYIVGLTPMKLSRFLLISSTARLPSIVTSTYLGASMREGRWGISIAIFVLTGFVGITGIVFNKKISQFCKKISIKLKDD